MVEPRTNYSWLQHYVANYMQNKPFFITTFLLTQFEYSLLTSRFEFLAIIFLNISDPAIFNLEAAEIFIKSAHYTWTSTHSTTSSLLYFEYEFVFQVITYFVDNVDVYLLWATPSSPDINVLSPSAWNRHGYSKKTYIFRQSFC